MKEHILRQLQQKFQDRPHEDVQSMSMQAWEEAGRPHVWQKVDVMQNYEVWEDIGYGYLALFHGGVLVDTGTSIVNSPEVVYFGRGHGNMSYRFAKFI